MVDSTTNRYCVFTCNLCNLDTWKKNQRNTPKWITVLEVFLQPSRAYAHTTQWWWIYLGIVVYKVFRSSSSFQMQPLKKIPLQTDVFDLSKNSLAFPNVIMEPPNSFVIRRHVVVLKRVFVSLEISNNESIYVSSELQISVPYFPYLSNGWPE